MYFGRNVPLKKSSLQRRFTRTEKPSENSFFFRAFNANLETAENVLNTPFIQGIKEGTLSPDFYGQLTVVDTYYCYKAVESYSVALTNTPASESDLADLIQDLMSSYNEYNDYFLESWHIASTESIVPTTNFKEYSMHEHNVAVYHDPIYILVAMIPCYYLWYWFSDKINGAVENNQYQGWIEGSLSPNSAYVIGNFIETWIAAGKEFDEDLALGIYRTSMNHELRAFQDAVPSNTL